MIEFDGKEASFSTSVLSRLINSAIKKDDDLTISNVRFDFNSINGKGKLKSIELVDCTFQEGVKVSEIRNGTGVHILNCTFEGKTGITLENVAVTAISFSGAKNSDVDKVTGLPWEVPYDAITFMNVVTEEVLIRFCDLDLNIMDSTILKQCRVTSIGTKDSRRTIGFLNTCLVNARLDIHDCHLNKFLFNGCNCATLPQQTRDKLKSGFVSFYQSSIKYLEIANSKCGHIRFNIENTPLFNVEIKQSFLNAGLNLYMSLTLKEEERLIHHLYIVDSTLGESIFNGRLFDLPLNLSGTTFLNAPRFHNLEIPQDSIFPPKDKFVEREGRNAIKAYRTLRLAMENQRAREEEGMFYALEQECILNTNFKNRKILKLSFWYQVLSDYGTSYVKPAIYLAFLFIFFSIIYSLLCSPAIGFEIPIDWQLIEKAFIFSMKQMFLPFSSLRDLSPLLKESDTHLLISFLGVIQSLASLLLFALLFFAIRWEFKRG